MTRSRSLTPKRAKQREMRIPAALNSGGAGKMVESAGSGYLPPHRAGLVGMSAEVCYAAGAGKGITLAWGCGFPHQLYAVTPIRILVL